MRYANDRLYTPEEAAARAEKDAREEFSGPWWYDFRWSDGGTVAEEGTHGELLALGGKYASLYEVQSKYYREGGDGCENEE